MKTIIQRSDPQFPFLLFFYILPLKWIDKSLYSFLFYMYITYVYVVYLLKKLANVDQQYYKHSRWIIYKVFCWNNIWKLN